MHYIFTFLLITSSLFGYSKKERPYSSSSIPKELLVNANSVVRNETVNVSISDIDKMEISFTRAVTILNARGLSDLDLSWGYEPDEKIKKLSVKIYDASGVFLRKLSSDEFRDRSALSGSTFHTDSRIISARARNGTYPFSVVVSYTFESPNTAFIPYYMPITGYNQSLDTSYYSISWPINTKAKHVELNLDDAVKNETNNSLSYSLKNHPAIEAEILSPSVSEQFPHAKWALEEFQLAGHRVKAQTWNELGMWMYSSLLKEGLELPDSTKYHIRTLVENLPSKKDRAKAVYEYMQSDTRYMSIQLGIGGWKPMTATEVNELGYGDCKALVNYTQALLAVAEVPSQYVVVYAGNQKRDIDKNVPSIQGNHVILRIPDEKEPIWLECTSQTIPFGLLGTFTDDRVVLAIDSSGGQLIRTPATTEEENRKILKGAYTIDEHGTLSYKGSIEAKGIFYQKFQRVERFSKREKRKFYESQFNVTLKELELQNSSFEAVENRSSYMHDFEFSSKNYAKTVGTTEILFPANPVLDAISLPENNQNRKNDICVERSYITDTELTFKFKKEQSLGHIPESKIIESEFGMYSLIILSNKDNTLALKRTLTIYQGTYSKTKYQAYCQFFKDIAEADGSKILLNQ